MSQSSSSSPSPEFGVIALLFELIDSLVETYLKNVITPFLRLHEKLYSRLNVILGNAIDSSSPYIPLWFTANLITYTRTILIVPCITLLSWGYLLLPSLIVILVDFGDFLDGVVARYWVDVNSKKKDVGGSEKAVPSWLTSQRNKTYGGFVDAVCDKAFVVPCWIYLLSTIPNDCFLEYAQYVIIWCLILAEVASGSIRFRAFYTSPAVPAPTVSGLDFSTSAVKADHVGKAKQTLEMVGTTLFILPHLRYLGLAFLFLAVPLAYESVRRKITKRVVFVHYNSTDSSKFDHTTLTLWMQAKTLGSKLVVGVPGNKTSVEFLNASAVSCVDEVLVDAPATISVAFMKKHRLDFYICVAINAKAVPKDVLSANKCLAIGDDGVARALGVKPIVNRI